MADGWRAGVSWHRGRHRGGGGWKAKSGTIATSMRNILLTIQYDGSRYCGWQRQPHGLSVQQVLEEALEPIQGGPVRLRAAGRTDAGVHAEGQAANFRTSSLHPAEAFLRSANTQLPPDVAIVAAREAPVEFDARRDARMRWYRYRIATGPIRPVFGREQALHCPFPLDPQLAAAALSLFEGRHDFAGLRSAHCAARRTVLDLECSLAAEAGRWTLDFQCRSFLHNMVRILAGAVLETARGKLGLADLEAVARSGRRDARIPTAAAHGLTLMAVGYPPSALRGGNWP